jgi:hypothetical protein
MKHTIKFSGKNLARTMNLRRGCNMIIKDYRAEPFLDFPHIFQFISDIDRSLCLIKEPQTYCAYYPAYNVNGKYKINTNNTRITFNSVDMNYYTRGKRIHHITELTENDHKIITNTYNHEPKALETYFNDRNKFEEDGTIIQKPHYVVSDDLAYGTNDTQEYINKCFVANGTFLNEVNIRFDMHLYNHSNFKNNSAENSEEYTNEFKLDIFDGENNSWFIEVGKTHKCYVMVRDERAKSNLDYSYAKKILNEIRMMKSDKVQFTTIHEQTNNGFRASGVYDNNIEFYYNNNAYAGTFRDGLYSKLYLRFR